MSSPVLLKTRVDRDNDPGGPGDGGIKQNDANDDAYDKDTSKDPETLVDWKNPPTVANLKQDLLDSKSDSDGKKAKIGQWLDNMHVRGAAAVKPVKGNSSIVPKLIRRQAEWRYAALSEPYLSTDDIFKVRPVTWEDRDGARQNELLLNNQFNTRIDKVTFIDNYVRAAVDEGTVIVRVGWKFLEEKYKAIEPVFDLIPNPELMDMHQALAEMRTQSPSQWQTDVDEEIKAAHLKSVETGVPHEAVLTGKKESTKTRTVANHPIIEVCDYKNIVIDPTCGDNVEDAQFVIYSFESSLSDLRKDAKYDADALKRINITGSNPLAEPDHEVSEGVRTFNFTDLPRKKVVVYEYWGFWDIDDNGIVKPIVAAWVGNTLIRLEENPYPDKKVPFVAAAYLPVRRESYGEPDGALLEDQQKIIGAVTRGIIDVMGKSANGQTGLRRDYLDTTNRRRYEKGLDYEYNPNVDPRTGVFMHTYPEIPASAQFMLELQNAEAESLTGVKAYTQGVSGASLGEVAVGVRGALDAASKRELGILRRLSAGLIKIGRKIVAMNAEFLDEEEVIRITNEEFVTIKKDDLAGNYDLRLSISTAEEDNQKAQELAFLYQTNGPNGDKDLNKMIMSDIARLRKMPDLAEKIENYEPEPDPIQQKMQELEIAKLEAEIQKINAETQLRAAQAQLDLAKIGTEQVKQGDIQSTTDQKNLDFVEQESGVTQERELQKHGEQARSVAKTEMLKSTMKADESDKDRRADILKVYLQGKLKEKTAA